MKLLFPFSGDDVFISYSRRDENEVGERYAVNLYEELKKRGFSSFLDRLGTEPGATQPESLNQKIRNSKMLVIVGTERACQSVFVEGEIKEFLKARRIPIVPIDFNGTVPKARWYPLIEGVTMELEPLEALESGIPTEDVIARIEEAFKYTKRNDQLRKATYGTFAILIALLLAVGGASIYASIQLTAARDAKNDADKARIEANQATEKSAKANEAASVATNKADFESKRANEQTNIANIKTEEANKAAKLADQKDKLAQEKTKIADAAINRADKETQKADIATKRADAETIKAEANRKKAEEQTRVAQQKTSEANRLLYATDTRLADSLYKDFDIQSFTNRLKNTDTNYRGIEWEYLNQLTKGSVEFQGLPDEPIGKITFTPDGKYLLTKLTKTKQLLRWDLQTGTSENVGENGQSDLVYDFSFSPDKQWLATCSYSTNNLNQWDISAPLLVIWDVSAPSWKRYVVPTSHKDRCGHLSFTADSRELLTIFEGTKGISIQHWNIQTKTKKGNPLVKKIRDYAEILGVSSTGQAIIKDYKFKGDGIETESASNILLIDSNFNETFIAKEENGCEVGNVAFSSNGKQIAVYGTNPKRRPYVSGVFVFDTNAIEKGLTELPQELVFSRNFKKLKERLTFSDNGELLALNFDNGIRIFNITTNKVIKEMPLESGFSGGLIAISSDESQLAVSSDSKIRTSSQTTKTDASDKQSSVVNRLTLWQLNSQSTAFTFENRKPVWSCEDCRDVISDDGSRLVTEGENGLWTVWDTFNKKKITTLAPLAVSSNHNRLSFFSTDAAYFFTQIQYPDGQNNENGNLLQIWDMATGKELNFLSESECAPTSNPVFSSDGNIAAVICKAGYIGVWNPKSGKKIREITIGTQMNVLWMNFIGDKIIKLQGQVFSSSAFYDLTTGFPVKITNDDIDISADGKWLIYGNKSIGYFLQNLLDKSAPPILLLEALKFRPPSTFFSPDSKFLYVFGVSEDFRDGTKTFTKNLITMEDMKSDSDASSGFFEYSPQNNWILEKTKSKIYYTNTLNGLKNNLSQCVENPIFSSDENRLITSCSDGTINFWDLLSGQEVLSIKAHPSTVKKLVLSKDEKHLLTVSENDAKLWRVKF